MGSVQRRSPPRRSKPRPPRVFKKEGGGSNVGCFLLLLLIGIPLSAGIWAIYSGYSKQYGTPVIVKQLSGVGVAISDAVAVADSHEVATWIVTLTDEERVAAGLAPLQRDKRIDAIAQAHSAAMLANRKLDHKLAGKNANDRAQSAGYNCHRALGGGRYTFGLSENISMHEGAWHFTPEPMARDMVDGWMDSPGHRANIMNPMNERIGVGVAQEGGLWYATQNFSQCQ